MMKKADNQLPSASSQIVARWTRARQPVPAEDPEPDERRLEQERGQPFDRQRRAEHVADELRVDRPVHPELELLHETGGDADREVDQHQRPEEARQAQPRLVARAVPERLHDRDERREPQRQRHEQEVVRARSSRTGCARDRPWSTRACSRCARVSHTPTDAFIIPIERFRMPSHCRQREKFIPIGRCEPTGVLLASRSGMGPCCHQGIA